MSEFHCTSALIKKYFHQPHFFLLFLGSSSHLGHLNLTVTFYHIEFAYLLQLI